MIEKKIREICELEAEIADLEDLIKNTKIENEILKLQIQKKEIIIKKLELEQS